MLLGVYTFKIIFPWWVENFHIMMCEILIFWKYRSSSLVLKFPPFYIQIVFTLSKKIYLFYNCVDSQRLFFHMKTLFFIL